MCKVLYRASQNVKVDQKLEIEKFYQRNTYIVFIHKKLKIAQKRLLVNKGPTSGGVVTLKTVRREVPGSNPGRACRPSCSEFSVVFFEPRVNTGYDPLERTPRRALCPLA